MDYRSCEVINTHFMVTDEGQVACPTSEMMVDNSLQRAYIFTNLFFYDITQREIGKLTKRIQDKREDVVNATEIEPDEVDKLLPNLSAQFRQEVGDNSLDPLIKVELAKIKPSLILQLSNSEKKDLDTMYMAICNSEINKFKKAVLITKDNLGKPYQINFSEKYIANLPERCRRFLKPTIKMLAYMEGLQFATFNVTPDYQISYTWSDDKPTFDETAMKDALKKIIAATENPVPNVDELL